MSNDLGHIEQQRQLDIKFMVQALELAKSAAKKRNEPSVHC
ncbi:hypothetical protein [Providencia sp. PROV266]|nr:hypothetical protein [Providencia sp. PROV266]